MNDDKGPRFGDWLIWRICWSPIMRCVDSEPNSSWSRVSAASKTEPLLPPALLSDGAVGPSAYQDDDHKKEEEKQEHVQRQRVRRTNSLVASSCEPPLDSHGTLFDGH